MMWVKVVTPFFGILERRHLRVGRVLKVDEARGEKMIERGLAVATPEPKAPKPKRTRRRRRKKEGPPEDKAQRPEEVKIEKPAENKADLTEGVAASEDVPEDS